MPKRRTSTNVLELKGAFRKNPSRARDRSNEPATNTPIGPAPLPGTLTFSQAWDYIVATCPHGVLKQRDRVVVELAARLLMQIRSSDMLIMSHALRLEQLMGRLGCSPSDASRVIGAPMALPNEFDNL